jgi:hypothetical protein
MPAALQTGNLAVHGGDHLLAIVRNRLTGIRH